MYLKDLFALGLALAMGMLGCTTPPLPTVWPEPRALGKTLPTYTPPRQPSTTPPSTREISEPTGTLTLLQAQALAVQHNPKLAAFGWEVRAGEARTLQAGLPPNPEVEIEVENFAGSGELQGFQGAEITIHLQQLIELAGKRRKRARVAALERDLTAWDYEAARLDVLTQVTQAFVEVLSAQEHLMLNTELVRLAEQVFSTVAERVKAGKVSPVEETKAGVELATSRMALERAQRDLEAARTRLAATWGGSAPAFVSAQGTLDAIAAIPPAEQLAERLVQNPEIARWAMEMAQRRVAIELARARRIPDPTIGGGFRHARDTGDNALVMSVSMPLPVFDRNQGGFLEARYQLAKAEEERRAAEIQGRAALAEVYAALSSAFVEATALKNKILPGAQRAFDAASEGYRQGKFGFLDVLDAQRTLFEARGQHLEALVAYHRAVAEVERLIGEPLGAFPDTPKPQENGAK
jgi:cobalt-zinc-cadmium efflux system outer membrane protein